MPRPTSGIARLDLRLPPELAERIKALAAADRRSVNSWAVVHLSALVEQLSKPEARAS